MAANVVRWFGDQVKQLVNRQAQKGVEALAYDVRENARQNLERSGHIDTKFLYNSIYVATPKGTSPIPPSGEYTSLKTGDQVRRNAAEPVQVNEGAFVGAAADYAVYVELADPFLFPALEETRGAADKVLTGLYA
jgi:Bacteriophage protein of unknown function (DUF646).